MLEPSSPSATPLARDTDTTLTEQLASRYAERIRQRLLAPGARLPSVRECARRHRVSPHTVVAAYDQLLALGLVEARRQRGFFVRETASPRAPPGGAGAAQRLPAHPLPISATALIRGMFQPPGARPMPGLGTLPADWLDLPLLAGALRKATAGAQLGAVSLQYGEPAGELRLRQALATKLADFGVRASAQQIVTTLGATHALDVVTRTLARAGDSVLVDEPGWSVEYARLAALGLRVLPVPRGEDGPDLVVMQRLIEAHKPPQRPRLYITVSVLNNPTGASLSLQAAHRVLQLAQVHGLRIVEDDTYAHLAPAHLPRMAALDALERTIYISGYSKILVPNWRVGFIAAPLALVDALVDTKLLSTLTTPGITELALAHCLEHGLLRRHTERVMDRLAQARDRTVKLAEAHGCRFASPPRGLFGWVDVGVDTERLAQAMQGEWLLAPGALFHATHRPTTLMRINFATTQDARFWRALDRARAQLAPARSPPVRGSSQTQLPQAAVTRENVGLMNGELFDSTIPFGEPELLKASAYRRYLQELDGDTTPGAQSTRLAQLSPSLQADLQRFEQRGGSSEAVEVVAACIRHSTRVTIYLQCAERVVPLTVFPHERLVHCPMDIVELVARHLPQLRVMHLEPATLRPPGDSERELIGESRLYHPIAPLLWELAVRGPRRDLLPEIAGPAVYRASPGLDLRGLPINGALRAAIDRLRRQATSLAGIAAWPAFDRERAARLLNALYLQAGLIVSRSHPDAVRDGWFG